MKNIKTLFSTAVFGLASLFAAANANAAMIYQDIEVNGVLFASFTFELDNDIEGPAGGLISTFDDGFDLVDVFLPIADGYNVTIDYFDAIIDASDIFAGIQYLAFEGIDDGGYGYQIDFDMVSPEFNYVEVFDFIADPIETIFVFEGEDIASISEVSEPAVFGLFALGFAGLMLRRRA